MAKANAAGPSTVPTAASAVRIGLVYPHHMVRVWGRAAVAVSSVVLLFACAPPGFRTTASRKFYLWIEKEEGTWKAPVASEPRGLTLPLKAKPLGVLIVAVESSKDRTPGAVPEFLREHEDVLRTYVTDRGATRYYIRRMEHRIRDVNLPYPAGGHTMYRHMDIGYIHLEVMLYE